MFRVLVMATVFTVAVTKSSVSAAEALEQEWQFVRHVLLTSEGRDGTKSITRWTRPPVIYTHSKDRDFRNAVRNTVDHINAVLPGKTFSAAITTDPSREWDIAVGAGSYKRFDTFFRNIGCKRYDRPAASGALCLRYYEQTHEIFAGIILIADDLTGRETASVLLEEIYQSYGVTNDHDIFPDSINFDDGVTLSERTTLAPIDIRVLRFLYQYLEPGDDEATVRAKFDTHWHTIDVD